MHALLVPTCKVYTANDSSRKRRFTRPSINDSRESFLLQIKDSSELQNKILNTTNHCVISKSTLQPLILSVGDNDEFYVYYFNILYKLPNFVKALDVCFKIFQVFNLKYPPQSELVWVFIQIYFYGIRTNSDKKSPQLCALLNEFKSHEINSPNIS